MTADLFPVPCDPPHGRHCAGCRSPEGLTPQRAVAHWTREHRGTPLVHTTHGVVP